MGTIPRTHRVGRLTRVAQMKGNHGASRMIDDMIHGLNRYLDPINRKGVAHDPSKRPNPVSRRHLRVTAEAPASRQALLHTHGT